MRTRRNRPSTPYLITVAWEATCACGTPIKKGDEALYYPQSRKLECRKCATRTLDALADERMMGNA